MRDTREMLADQVEAKGMDLDKDEALREALIENNRYTYEAETETWLDPDGNECEPDEGDLEEALVVTWAQTQVLDVQYLVDSDGTMREARALVACGGPTVWIIFDGGDYATVEGSWGGEQHADRFRDEIGAGDYLLEGVSFQRDY